MKDWKENIGIAFDNNSNCYADTDSLIPAMTRGAVENTFIPIIESLLKQQREICANEWDSWDFTTARESPTEELYNKLLNAPEPGKIK